ncbi:ABC transporter substrate-binding protein [Beggiatoa alba]|nr:extracellular solute-binding protein [Beggiatoa alba]
MNNLKCRNLNLFVFFLFSFYTLSLRAEPIVLKIHTWTGYVKPYEKEFQAYAKTQCHEDIQLEVTYATGLTSFVEQLTQNTADLISPANDVIEHLWQKQLIRPLDLEKIPNFRQVNPIILRHGFYRLEGQVYAAPFTFGPYALAYNKDRMQAPTSYVILWDERYRKRVSISGDFYAANIYMVALFLKIPESHLFNLSDTELSKIKNRLSLLHTTQIYRYWESNLEPNDMNELDVGMDWGVGVHMINARGGNWDLVIPEEGATAWVDSWVMASGIANKKIDAAYCFINFMLSATTQAQVMRQTGYGGTNLYVSRYMSVKEQIIYHVTDPDYLRRLILWQPLPTDILEKYEAIWKQATQN